MLFIVYASMDTTSGHICTQAYLYTNILCKNGTAIDMCPCVLLTPFVFVNSGTYFDSDVHLYGYHAIMDICFTVHVLLYHIFLLMRIQDVAFVPLCGPYLTILCL